MRLGLLKFLIYLCVALGSAQAQPKPLLVLMDFNAWFPSVGPSLVIYDDGLVIYQTPKEISLRTRHDYSWVNKFGYMSSRGPDPDAFIRTLFPNNWAALKAKYRLSESTDQDTTLVWYRGQIVEIYGDWRRFLETAHYGDSEEGKQLVESENALRRSLPEDFRHLLLSLDNYTDKKAKAWVPAVVKVDLYKFERPTTKQVVWPKDFPKPDYKKYNSSRGFITETLPLPGRQYAKFRKILSEIPSPGVVSIDGSNFIVSNFVFVFPGEEMWKDDLAKRAQQERDELEERLKALPPEKEKEMRKWLGL